MTKLFQCALRALTDDLTNVTEAKFGNCIYIFEPFIKIDCDIVRIKLT